MNEKIPTLDDEAWFNQAELGEKEIVVEYVSGHGTSKVRVTAHVLSGAVVESMEARHMKLNTKTGEVELDTEAYLRALVKQVFRLTDAKYDAIMSNKSSDLRMKLRTIATETIGLGMTEKEIEQEKNSVSPEPPTTS